MSRVGVVLAGLAAALGGWGAALLLERPLRRNTARLTGVARVAGKLADEVLAPLRRAGAEGRDATSPERRRLQAAFAARVVSRRIGGHEPHPRRWHRDCVGPVRAAGAGPAA